MVDNPTPNPKLETYPLTAACDCLFNIYHSYPPCMEAVSSTRNTRTRRAMVTGTHITRIGKSEKKTET